MKLEGERVTESYIASNLTVNKLHKTRMRITAASPSASGAVVELYAVKSANKKKTRGKVLS